MIACYIMLAKAEAAAGVAQRWFLMTLAVARALVIAGLGLAISLAGTHDGASRACPDGRHTQNCQWGL